MFRQPDETFCDAAQGLREAHEGLREAHEGLVSRAENFIEYTEIL